MFAYLRKTFYVLLPKCKIKFQGHSQLFKKEGEVQNLDLFFKKIGGGGSKSKIMDLFIMNLDRTSSFWYSTNSSPIFLDFLV